MRETKVGKEAFRVEEKVKSICHFFGISEARLRELLKTAVDSSAYHFGQWMDALVLFMEHEKHQLHTSEEQLQQMIEYLSCVSEASKKEILTESLAEIARRYLKEQGFENQKSK